MMNYFYLVFIFSFLALFLICPTFAEITYIWKEAENPDHTNFSINIASGPKGEVLSNGKWLMQTFTTDEVKTGKLENDLELAYNFDIAKEGLYRFWIRIGYEFARSPISWKIDDSNWNEISPFDLSQNLIGLSAWCEVGWLNPAEIPLSSGKHTLYLKADKPSNDGRFLLAIDVFAFVQGDWKPEDKLKPGEEPNSELDIQAKNNIFYLKPEKDAIKRTELSLDGVWQICRSDDLNMDQSPYEPVTDIPDNPRWRGIKVPSNMRSIPELDLAHRVWYCCRVDIPKDFQGQSFFLNLSGTNWIASVVVNGKMVGSHKSTRIPWKLDITNAIKTGQVNEIMIGIKDVWYAIDHKFHKKELKTMRNIPADAFQWTRFVAPVYPSTKGDADGTQCGITDPITLVVTGPVYVDDVFIQTKVAEKKIIADYTLKNTSSNDVKVGLKADALFEGNNKIEKAFQSKNVLVPANSSIKIKLEESWANPKLWFPGDDPANMYLLISKVTIAGKVRDQFGQRFGFREVTIDGKYIRINGLRRNFWNLLDCLKGTTPEERLAHFRKGNNRFERFSEDLGLRRSFGIRQKQLDWTDTHGIPGRLSTMIDGMFINYDLTNPVTWENFRDHVRQVVLVYRNHPSIIVYSLENELILINGRLNYGEILDQVEGQAKEMVESARELDPTRPYMLDGAGALKGNLLEINNLHYPEPSTEFFPENAYTLERWGEMGKRWVWDKQRPLAMGETAFFSGKNSEHAWIGGDSVFLGRNEAKRAYARYVKMLIEGYRWNDVAMICPWVGMDDFPDCWNSMSSLAVFVREYSKNFFAGDKVIRTVKVFNDTFSNKPLEFSWSVKIGQDQIAGDKYLLNIEPGFNKEMTIQFSAPLVKEKTNAKLFLAVYQGNETFNDVKDISFFPKIAEVKLKRQVYVLENDGEFSKKLAEIGINARSIRTLAESDLNGILVIAPNTLTDEMSKSDEFKAYAENGGRIICLEQDHPFSEPAFPIKATDHQAYFAFPLGYGVLPMTGLDDTNLSNWSGQTPTAKKVWEPKSVRSWIACGNELKYSALIEMVYGSGLIIASQMQIGTKMDIEPSAQLLLSNLLRYCDDYKLKSADVTVYAPQKPEIAEFTRASGCNVIEINKLDDAISKSNLLVVNASKDNLELLLSMQEKIDELTNDGKWIMLWGLEPDGINAFNKLLKTEHLIREFRIERVSIEKDMLTSGLGNRDVVQYSNEEIMHGDKWLSQEVFTYCVDTSDIAPFCKLPGQKDEPYRPTKDDHDPYNLVNGMTGHDFWRYILQIWHGNWGPEGSPPFVFGLPVPCKIKSVKIWNNAYYNTIKDVDILIDGKKVATLELPDAMMPAEINLNDELAEKELSLIIRSIRKRQDRQPLVGIDNIQIVRELPDWYKDKVFPLVNVGGLVRYPRGKGGFILNQIKLTDQDTKENISKKHRIARMIIDNAKETQSKSNI
ncbi:MAG: glycosyl hydrolase 2 galactose-binding domain-containing protein [Candidatus Poribacteria bacterium]